jgi:hypothetical protein
MNKKAQGLSVETIALVVIAAIIIVVISYLIVGRTSIFTTTLEDCKTKGGDELTRADCLINDGVPSSAIKGSTNKICCLKGG